MEEKVPSRFLPAADARHPRGQGIHLPGTEEWRLRGPLPRQVYGIWGLGFKGSGFRVEGLGFWDIEFGV